MASAFATRQDLYQSVTGCGRCAAILAHTGKVRWKRSSRFIVERHENGIGMNVESFQDRYAVERRLAAQIEAEWSDVCLGDLLEQEIPAAARLGLAGYLARPAYHQSVAEWVQSMITPVVSLTSVADIGAGLGRFLFELMGQCPSIQSATFVEPSPTLYRWAQTFLTIGSTVAQVPFLKGLGEVGWHSRAASVPLDASRLDKLRLLHGAADAPALKDAQFDLVTALNMLDQCAYPTVVAQQIMKLVAPGGCIVLSCAHQFQPSIYIDEATVFGSLHDLFGNDVWRLVAETELPFVSRMGERHRNWFLSHHVLYQRVA